MGRSTAKASVCALMVLNTLASAAFAREPTWRSLVKPVADFKYHVAAVATSTAGTLLVATRKELFEVVNDGAPRDVTPSVPKDPGDDITNIHVEDQQTLWIALNGNGFSIVCGLERGSVSSCAKWGMAVPQDFCAQPLPDPLPSTASIETMACSAEGTVLGFFRGDVFFCPAPKGRCRRLYKPTSDFRYALASKIAFPVALVSTCGDGLLVIDLRTGDLRRYDDD